MHRTKEFRKQSVFSHGVEQAYSSDEEEMLAMEAAKFSSERNSDQDKKDFQNYYRRMEEAACHSRSISPDESAIEQAYLFNKEEMFTEKEAEIYLKEARDDFQNYHRRMEEEACHSRNISPDESLRFNSEGDESNLLNNQHKEEL